MAWAQHSTYISPYNMSNRPDFLHAGYVAVIALSMVFSTCSPQPTHEPPAYEIATRLAIDWNRLLLELEWHTQGYRAPISARMFAYTEMAAYEAALPAMAGYTSLNRTHQGYQRCFVSAENYFLPAAVNTAFAFMARAFFSTAPPNYFEKIQQLEAQYNLEITTQANKADIQYSNAFGYQTAAAVWQYSTQDSIGHNGVKDNYDLHFKPEVRAGCWKIDSHYPSPPLLPHWGKVRSFTVNKDEIVAKPPIPFNESAGSAFFSEALEVFSIHQSLTAEERWIAEFWSDDLPGLTVTPVGRWMSITTQAVKKSTLPFPEVMETYLKTAIALHDAAVVCWDKKYIYQVERPESYIRRNIKTDWEPMHSSPAFPSYPSGHAIFGAAAAEILSEAFGEQFELVDYTHKGRIEFKGSPRKFDSFLTMADENAYSRMLIGVHFRNDCEEGLRLGKLVGKKVVDLKLHDVIVASLWSN